MAWTRKKVSLLALTAGRGTVVFLQAFLLLVLAAVPAVCAAKSALPPDALTPGYAISKVTAAAEKGALQIVIAGEGEPVFTSYEMFGPQRLVVDIAGGSFARGLALPLEYAVGPVARVQGKTITRKAARTARLEIYFREDRVYTVTRAAQGIVVAVGAGLRSTQPALAVTPGELPPARGGVKKEQPPAEERERRQLVGVDLLQEGEAARFLLRFDAPIATYSRGEVPPKGEVFGRLYVDIPDSVIMKGLQREVEGSGPVARVRVGRRKGGVRAVFDAAGPEMFVSSLEKVPEGLLLQIGAEKAKAAAVGGKDAAAAQSPATGGGAKAVGAPPALSVAKASPAGPASKDQFSAAGYKEQRISVDFHKIDLHNVFRLIGEVSGKNIVVEESVAGMLSLSLKNVPWDFALDVILNLKDLQREERFGTIVILPKKKNFSWPERSRDRLSIEENKETLKVIQKLEIPKNMVEARKLLREAAEAEQAESYDRAAVLYEKAMDIWPQNAAIGMRLSGLHLGRLKGNAKAVHFAKKVLALEPQNTTAALYAAIGLANMKKEEDADRYFLMATGGAAPPAAAILNYAAFLEQTGKNEAALKLLGTHDRLHGESLDSMMARARLLDKLGRTAEAASQYRSVLLSGLAVPEDLQRYIRGRVVLDNKEKR